MKAVQSYYSMILKADFSTYVMRMFLKVVQRTKAITGSYKIIGHVQQRAYCADGINLNFAVPVKEIIGTKSHNYKAFYKAIDKQLKEKNFIVQMYDRDKKVWRATPVFYNVEVDERSGILHYSVAKWLADYIVDYRNGGYRSYDFENAMKLSNPNAARLYLIVAEMKSPYTFYDIEQFREVLGIGGKYKKNSDLERRVLKPAAEELKKKGMNGFAFRWAKAAPGHGRALVLVPIKREEKAKNIGEQKEKLKAFMPDLLQDYLTMQCGFSIYELANNAPTIKSFLKVEQWQTRLMNIIDRARRKRKNKGYIIAAMKNIIAEQPGD